jgi:putative ABC transport system permease protein
MLLDFFRLIFKDINRRKFSSALTFLGISLGIMTIFLIFVIGESFELSLQKEFEQLGTNRLYVAGVTQSFGSNEVSGKITDTELRLLESKPYVDKIFPYFFQRTQIEFGNNFYSKQLIGTNVNEEFFEGFGYELQLGRYPKENEKYSVVLGALALDDMFEKKADIGSNIYIKDTKFKVVGIMESFGNRVDDNSIYVQIDSLRDLFDGGNSISVMDIVVKESVDIDSAEVNIKVLLENKLGDDTIEITKPAQLLEQVSSILDIVKYTLGGIAFVSLIVGSIGIINTMYVIVTEKTKEIGIMKSIGARNNDILLLYVIQSGTFGFLGSIIGLILGVILANLFGTFVQNSDFSFLEIYIQYIDMLYLLIFGFFIGVVSGFLPARKASKINIIEAMGK